MTSSGLEGRRSVERVLLKSESEAGHNHWWGASSLRSHRAKMATWKWEQVLKSEPGSALSHPKSITSHLDCHFLCLHISQQACTSATITCSSHCTFYWSCRITNLQCVCLKSRSMGSSHKEAIYGFVRTFLRFHLTVMSLSVFREQSLTWCKKRINVH